MAHEIEITERGASFAYVAEHGAPWHGLGTGVTKEMTAGEIAKAALIDWGLEKVAMKQFDNEFIVPGFYALRRDSDKKVYDVVTDLYKPLQPSVAIGFFQRFLEAGDMTMESCGSLQDGRRIFATAKLKEAFTLLGGDRVEGYLLLTSPHFAGECALAKFTSVRTVCMNTLRMALGDGRDSVRIPHLSEFDEAAQERVARDLSMATAATKQFKLKAEALSQCWASDEDTLRFLLELTGSGVAAIAADEQELEEALEIADEKAKKEPTVDDLNRVGKKILNAIISAPGQELKSAHGTWWGVVNGVSYVADHEGSRNLDKRYASAWFGGKADLKNRGFDLAMKYAGIAEPETAVTTTEQEKDDE